VNNSAKGGRSWHFGAILRKRLDLRYIRILVSATVGTQRKRRLIKGHATLFRKRRKALGLTFPALAKRVGVTKEFLWGIQSGKMRPSIDVVHRMAAALDIRPWYRLLDDLSLGMPAHLQAPNGKQSRASK